MSVGGAAALAFGRISRESQQDPSLMPRRLLGLGAAVFDEFEQRELSGLCFAP